MKNQFNHRNYRNNNLRVSNAGFRYNPLSIVIAMTVGLQNFGVRVMSFLNSLVMGYSPLAGLTTKQRMQMDWLRFMC